MKFACPQCGQHLDGEAGYAGRTINCPACGYGFAVPSAASVRPLAAAPAVRRVPQAPSHAARPRTSPLAIWSLVLSLATMVLGPFGCVPGIVCGHLARRAMRRDPSLGGRGLATTGLVVGYALLAVGLVLTAFVAALTVRTAQQLASTMPPRGAARPAAGNALAEAAGEIPAEAWTINEREARIPQQPAQGVVAGEAFTVKRARLVGDDLVLSGSASEELPELRLAGCGAGGGDTPLGLREGVRNAARFRVYNLVLGNGRVNSHFAVRYRSARQQLELSERAGLRLVLNQPENSACAASLHLGLGDSDKGYVMGQCRLVLPPDLAASVQAVNPDSGASDFVARRRGNATNGPPGARPLRQ